MGNMKRQRYLSYLVFDQQKIRYYGVFDATYPLSDAELRFAICTLNFALSAKIFVDFRADTTFS
jgi:hypothetical protein